MPRESVNLVRLRVQPSVSGGRANVKLHAALTTSSPRTPREMPPARTFLSVKFFSHAKKPTSATIFYALKIYFFLRGKSMIAIH